MATHRTPLSAVVLASAVAWLGLALGLGAGLPWLLDDGASPTASAGTAALLLGLCALVVGAVLLGRRLPGWWRLLLLPWLLAIAVGTYALAIAVAVNHVAPTAVPDPPAALAAGSEVTMTTAEGVRLAGWYLPGTNRAAVVVRHGAGSQRFDAAAQAEVLHRHGYGVLLVDARGHGRSEGRAMDLGWHGEADTAAALDLLVGRPEVDPGRIAVLGLSMGGEEALGAAGADPRVRAVVAEGATGRTAADRAWLPQEYGAAGAVQQQLDRVTYGLVDLLSGTSPPASLAESVRSSAPVPVLLIAAGQVPDEALVAQRLQAASPGTVTVWVADGAGHTGALATDAAQWQGRVLALLDAALVGEPAP